MASRFARLSQHLKVSETVAPGTAIGVQRIRTYNWANRVDDSQVMTSDTQKGELVRESQKGTETIDAVGKDISSYDS